METQTEASTLTQKTRELCQSILDEPEIQSLRQKMDAFLANDEARGQYDAVMMKGEMLQQKQQSGIPLTEAEVSDFDQMRDTFLKNPIARGFLDAQEGMQKVQKSVTQYVSKTIELGRVPEESDLESGSCGSGCGCHH